MSKVWPNIVGGYESQKEKILVESIRKHVDDIDDAAFVAEGAISAVEGIQSNQGDALSHLIMGPRIFQPAAIVIGTTDPADVLMSQPLIVLSNGELLTIAADEIDISALPSNADFIAVATERKYICLLTVDIAGAIDAVQGESVPEADDPVIPDAPEGTLGFGIVSITTGAETTFGTTALTAIATFQDLLTPLS